MKEKQMLIQVLNDFDIIAGTGNDYILKYHYRKGVVVRIDKELYHDLMKNNSDKIDAKKI